MAKEKRLRFYFFGFGTYFDLVPQLFLLRKHGELFLISIKIVDYILMTGIDEQLRKFLADYNRISKLEEVVYGPGTLRFHGLDIIQDEDMTVTIHEDDNLQALGPYSLTRIRRRQVDEAMNKLGKSHLCQLMLRWDGLGFVYLHYALSILHTFIKKITDCQMSALVALFSALCTLERHGTQSFYPITQGSEEFTLVYFADASRTKDTRGLCFIVALVVGPVKFGSTVQLVAWSSRRSKRPAKSTPSAEILAASEGVDELVIIKRVASTVLKFEVKTTMIVDSKDLCPVLSLNRNTVDRFVRPDVNSMRFQYETVIHFFVRIRGSLNPADVGTRNDNPLTEALMSTMATGKIHICFQECLIFKKDKSYG